jgi:hypothetical protein
LAGTTAHALLPGGIGAQVGQGVVAADHAHRAHVAGVLALDALGDVGGGAGRRVDPQEDGDLGGDGHLPRHRLHRHQDGAAQQRQG